MLSKSGCKYFCIPKFGVDAAFFIETQGRSHLRLLEFKCYGGARQGGVGFGNSKGFGPQVEILKQDSEKLSLTNPYVRWVLVNSLLPYGSERYAFFDCAVAKASAMGKEIIHGKQNNLRISQ
uniref:hypothetical protein n=1 Tax=Deinococcus sp. TaxID=47478 RepID=UPI0025C3917A